MALAGQAMRRKLTVPLICLKCGKQLRRVVRGLYPEGKRKEVQSRCGTRTNLEVPRRPLARSHAPVRTHASSPKNQHPHFQHLARIPGSCRSGDDWQEPGGEAKYGFRVVVHRRQGRRRDQPTWQTGLRWAAHGQVSANISAVKSWFWQGAREHQCQRRVDMPQRKVL